MLDNWQIGLQIDFLIDIIFALAAGFVKKIILLL